MGTISTSAASTGSNAARDAAAEAVAALVNGGKLRIYSGSAPADANAALSGNTLLAELTMGNPAFGAAAAGVVTANAVTSDSSADNTGIPSFFRILTSADAVVYQGDAGDAAYGAHSARELQLTDLTGTHDGTAQIIAGVAVSVSSLTLSQTASYA